MSLMENSKNFWPAEIGTQKMVVPKTVLVEQAGFFNEMTKNRLVAKVNSHQLHYDNDQDLLVHEFDITAPSLGNYAFTLFTVSHDITIFPLAINFDLEGATYRELDEKGFEATLKSIFTNKKTISTINGLIAQL